MARKKNFTKEDVENVKVRKGNDAKPTRIHENINKDGTLCAKCGGTGYLRMWCMSCNKCGGTGEVF
jgi:RecJ-like exonuclease